MGFAIAYYSLSSLCIQSNQSLFVVVLYFIFSHIFEFKIWFSPLKIACWRLILIFWVFKFCMLLTFWKKNPFSPSLFVCFRPQNFPSGKYLLFCHIKLQLLCLLRRLTSVCKVHHSWLFLHRKWTWGRRAMCKHNRFK